MLLRCCDIVERATITRMLVRVVQKFSWKIPFGLMSCALAALGQRAAVPVRREKSTMQEIFYTTL